MNATSLSVSLKKRPVWQIASYAILLMAPVIGWSLGMPSQIDRPVEERDSGGLFVMYLAIWSCFLPGMIAAAISIAREERRPSLSLTVLALHGALFFGPPVVLVLKSL